MTTTDTPRNIYIAGPMRGREKFNFPAFYAAEKELQAKGWVTLNPARADNDAGFDETTPQENVTREMMNEFLLRDARMLSQSDAIYLLDGWETSKGARGERGIAEWLGLEIIHQSPID